MKSYPLEIVMLEIADGPGYVSKGHQDKQAFCDAVSEEVGEPDSIDPDEVQHIYMRIMPAPRGSGVDCLYLVADKPGRGVFPATYWYE